MDKKGFAILPIVLIIVGILVVSGTGVYLYKINKQQTTNNQQQANDETASWKTYRNDKYGFEVKYPKNYYLFGDLILNEKAGTLNSDPVIADLNKDLPISSGLKSEGIFISTINFSSLQYKTRKEACDEDVMLNPIYTSCEISQEDLINERSLIESLPVNYEIDGTDIINANKKIIEVNGVKGSLNILFSPQWGGYNAEFSTFTKNGDKINLEVYLRDSKTLEQALNDKYTAIFKQVISTFKFIK